MDKKIYIIIVTFNGEKLIRDCLQSVFAKQTFYDFQVIVIDNHSTDQTCAIISNDFPEVLLIKNNDNFGFARANNLGIKKALAQGAEYLVLLNQDTEVSTNFIKGGIEYFDKHANVSMASPLILYPDKSSTNTLVLDKQRIWFAGAKIYRGREILFYPKFRIGEHIHKKRIFTAADQSNPLDWLPACALWLRKEVFSKIGYLDENFFMYGEDIDFCLRAKKAGLDFGFIASTFVLHKENFEQPLRLNKYWLRKLYYRTVGRMKIISRYFNFSEKCYYTMKLFYSPFFQLFNAIKKVFS